MRFTKFKKGEVLVHLRYECETIFKETKDKGWVGSEPRVLYATPYGECDKCGTVYNANEHLFSKKNEIHLYEPGSEMVEIQTSGNQNPTVRVMVNNEKIFAMLEVLGWVVDPIYEKLPPIPGMFEKIYCCPKGKGLFGGLEKDKADKLLEETKEALSNQRIPFCSRELTLADML